jgi:hypothetical protein
MMRWSSRTKSSGATRAQLEVPMQVERSIRTVREPTFRSSNSVTVARRFYPVVLIAFPFPMSRINMKRVVLGGIAAAVIVNLGEALLGFLLKRDYEGALRALGIRMAPNAMTLLPIAWSFVVGILAIWLYAAIRPRYGPGPRTAVRAGLALWAFSTVTFSVAMACLGIFPARLMVIAAAWSLVEVIVAVLVGAGMYREETVHSP